MINNVFIKYNMRKLRIKKVDAAYFLEVRILYVWFTLRTYISTDSSYALLCANEAMEKLQEKI